MRILVACEFSGVVREGFRAKGHEAWSRDLLPSDVDGYHLIGDVIPLLNDFWDMLIAFPPCTHLAVSGAKWFKQKREDGRQQQAIDFFMALANAAIDKIAIENPVGIMSTIWRKPDQIVQPWMFGEPYTKTTCLWLKNLPKLVPTNIVDRGDRHITKSGKSLPEWYNLPPREDRWAIRSKTFQGIADAMADQWGWSIRNYL